MGVAEATPAAWTSHEQLLIRLDLLTIRTTMWPFHKRPEKSLPEVKFASFTSSDLSYAKYHALRALCGLFMDRHSACSICPFCGSPSGTHQLIVHAEMQTDATTNEPLLALYFCNATPPSDGPKPDSIEAWAQLLTYAESAPSRKAVVRLLNNGTYFAEYGPIANPVHGDYSTGMLDRSEWTLPFSCDPEPAYARWQYRESQMPPGQRVVPEFRCLQTNGEWWIVDIDRERRMVQQVAALTVADNPDHSANRSVPDGQGTYYIGS